MAMFSGRCEGGPYHNRYLHHGTPTFQMVINNGKPLTYKASEAMKEDPARNVMRHGEYRHKNDRWVWKET